MLKGKSIAFMILFFTFFSFQIIKAQSFDPENITSDEEFQNVNSMTLADIQTFLESRNGGLKDQNLWQQYHFSYPEYSYFYNYVLANGKLGRECSPSEIIYYSATDDQDPNYPFPNHVNPKVLIAMLQKEQSLIDDPSKTTQSILDKAAGYSLGDPKYKGFFNQVISMAFELTKDFNARQPGVQPPMQVNSVSGIVTITPQNRATAVLYEYNPSIEGNKNFWEIYCLYSAYTGDISSRMNSSMNGVSYFSQLDNRWSSDTMVSSSYTIGSSGCTMTCVAMVFNYYGVHAVQYTFNDYFTNDTNPKDLNWWLKNNGGYTSGNYLVWPVTENYSDVASKSVDYRVDLAQDWSGGINASDSQTLINEINNGHPVIVKVYTGLSTYPWHWVLIINISGSNFYINDPYWSDRTTLDY
ncbi:MAG: C39 family peptidase [bacterium]